jgi:hypothetical protein
MTPEEAREKYERGAKVHELLSVAMETAVAITENEVLRIDDLVAKKLIIAALRYRDAYPDRPEDAHPSPYTEDDDAEL